MTKEEDRNSYLGDTGSLLYEMSENVAEREWSFDADEMSADEWRDRAREELLKGLLFSPEKVPLEPRVLKSENFSGYTQYWVDFASTKYYRATSVLLIPDEENPPYPAAIGLHDHGGFLYYGKEKIVEVKQDLPRLKAHKESAYGGRSWASELARRGYVVLVPDALGWGIRNVECPDIRDPFSVALSIEREENVEETNTEAMKAVAHMDKHLAFSGLSWEGIVNWDERRCVDYLLSREEVDSEKIACVGLSGGGFRSTYLFGSDPRIACAGITGWMTRLADQLIHFEPCHLNMHTAPCVTAKMDHCDVGALGVPRPLFVQQCERDNLYTVEAMRESCKHIEKVYSSFGSANNFRCKFYDKTHCFDQSMQEEMFSWLDDVL